MPLLSRMIAVPLAVDIRAGAVQDLAALLADHRISAEGQVAVAVGPGQGVAIAELIVAALPQAVVIPVEGGTVDGAQRLRASLRERFYDAVVGIGGGRLIDTVKWAATLSGLPMVAVATNLAHDGLASPVASLEHEGRKGSYGVQMPLAVVVDMDYVRQSPPRMRRSGIGDAVSNLSALADWELAAQVRGEKVDGLAASMARTAALAVLHHRGSIDEDAFLIALAEGLVLSGLAMAVAGTSRPCSGGCHEILHAIDSLHPGTSNHGELAGVGALFCTFLRKDEELFDALCRCLSRHGLPLTAQDLGLTERQFAEAVVYAPSTRPDRYTILEHLDLAVDEIRHSVRDFHTSF
ncbi:MAG: iron-containing alcohol dehydrogenase family protein [Microthrixaceae bacterium]